MGRLHVTLANSCQRIRKSWFPLKTNGFLFVTQVAHLLERNAALQFQGYKNYNGSELLLLRPSAVASKTVVGLVV